MTQVCLFKRKCVWQKVIHTKYRRSHNTLLTCLSMDSCGMKKKLTAKVAWMKYAKKHIKTYPQV